MNLNVALNSHMWLMTIALDHIDFGGLIGQARQLESGRPGPKPRSAGFPSPAFSLGASTFSILFIRHLSPLFWPLFVAPFPCVVILLLRDATGKGEKKSLSPVCFISDVLAIAIAIINYLHSHVIFPVGTGNWEWVLPYFLDSFLLKLSIFSWK